jgi:type I restriction enzyme, S subunit
MLEGWRHATVEEICQRVSVGIVIKPSQYYVENGEGIRAFRSANIGENKVVDRDWVYLSNAGHEANKKSALREGDVLVVRSGAPGTACVVPKDFAGSNCIDVVFARPDRSQVLPEYLASYTNSDVGKQHVLGNKGGLALQHFNVGAYKEMLVLLPPLPEQRKIAEILRTWDEALEKLTALRAAKVRRISSLRQQLFEAEYSSHNRLQRAKDLFETVSERGRTDLPLLAVMQDIGIVRRDELDRRVAMPDGDTSSYKVVRPGDFVISLRSFEGGLEYSSIIGLVSPAYTVLRPTTDLIGDYYRHFFKSRSFIGRVDKLIFGIRDGKQIAFRDFGDMSIPAPPVAEQEAQARALGSLEADLALEDARIGALTRQKRGLMQKLLTGEWRVSP